MTAALKIVEVRAEDQTVGRTTGGGEHAVSAMGPMPPMGAAGSGTPGFFRSLLSLRA